MDIPCAILIAAFCLPDANSKIEVKSGLEGSDAIVAIGEVRAHILLTDDEGAPPTAMDRQLCFEDVCVAYTARVRPEASAVELLIAGTEGPERFIQLRGPLDQVAAVASRMTFVAEARRRWVHIPLSEFKVVEPQPAGLPDAEPGPEQGPEQRPEPGPEYDTAPEPDIAPVPEFGPRPDALPESELQGEPEWLRPNRPY